MTFIKLLVAWIAEMLAHYARHYVWTHIVVTGSCCYVHKPYDYTHPYLQTFEPQLSWWWWRLQLYSVTKLNDLPFSKLVVCQQQFSIRVLKPFAVKTGQCRLLMTQNDDERSHHNTIFNGNAHRICQCKLYPSILFGIFFVFENKENERIQALWCFYT